MFRVRYIQTTKTCPTTSSPYQIFDQTLILEHNENQSLASKLPTCIKEVAAKLFVLAQTYYRHETLEKSAKGFTKRSGDRFYVVEPNIG